MVEYTRGSNGSYQRPRPSTHSSTFTHPLIPRRSQPLIAESPSQPSRSTTPALHLGSGHSFNDSPVIHSYLLPMLDPRWCHLCKYGDDEHVTHSIIRFEALFRLTLEPSHEAREALPVGANSNYISHLFILQNGTLITYPSAWSPGHLVLLPERTYIFWSNHHTCDLACDHILRLDHITKQVTESV